MQAKCFKFAGGTVEVQCCDRFLATVAGAAALCFDRILFACFFVEVRELVGAEQYFLAFGNSIMAGLVACIDGFLHLAGFDSFQHTAFFFHIEEQVPCLFGDGDSQVFDKI